MRVPRPPLTLLLFAAALLGAAGCGSAYTTASDLSEVAVVNGQRLSDREFDRFVTVKLGEFAREALDDTVRSELFDEFVKREITVQAAREMGLSVQAPGVRSQGQAAERLRDEQALDLLAQQYFQDAVLKDVSVTSEEITSYYAANRADYCPSEGYYVREIRVASRGEAERLRDDILSGRASFAEAAHLAGAAAEAPLAYDPAALPASLSEAVRPLRDGHVSDVVGSKLGYHLFLRERCGADVPTGRVRDRVARDLRARKNERLVEAAVERLLETASVEINEDRLSFQYEGRFANQ